MSASLAAEAAEIPLTSKLEANLDGLRQALGASDDFTLRRLDNGCALVYIDGLVDSDTVSRDLVAPLLTLAEEERQSLASSGKLITELRSRLAAGELRAAASLTTVIDAVLNGSTVVLAEGLEEALTAGTPGWERRAVEEPKTQTVVRGPKESFTETLRTNTSLLRRKIRSPKLRLHTLRIGRVTQTQVALAYIEGVADEGVVRELRRRLEDIDTDSILESCYIEEFIEDSPYSPLPTLANTERPDAVAAGLLEGQVAVFVDGTPFVLLGPVTFFNFLQSSEDYYQRYDIATFIRLIRYVSFVVSMLLPAMYIAITTFHQEMLPTTLLISLAAQREGVPFPAFVEAMIMEVTFEVLREAGIRMPRVVGPAISIVGALVLGQAAVQAGLVSAAMVIVVSFTAISNFVIPALNVTVAARLVRFLLMILAATLGLFGIVAGFMALLIHMASIRSLGVPYLSPLAPLNLSSLKDAIVRMPWWTLKTRPQGLAHRNRKRQKDGMRPAPPRGEQGS
ncbi:spore germination protein KA [Paenibacillus mucilaginosus]|uniref:spore germination protein n=1 Tax=Paenibacillus mucilaginosus TaxID=61624 RepID=UPI003D208E81